MERNRVAAIRRYRRAAAQGQASTRLHLGYSYAEGDGVLQDFAAAYVWLGLAGSLEGAVDQGLRASLPEDFEEEMPPDRFAETKRRTKEWNRIHKPGSAEDRQHDARQLGLHDVLETSSLGQ